jgi:glycerol kinase
MRALAIDQGTTNTRAVLVDAAGHDPAVVVATGLGITPLFPASNLVWALRPVPAAAELLALAR